MFRSFGHNNSSVLDGGLPGWEIEGLPIETGHAEKILKSTYPVPDFASENVRSKLFLAVMFYLCFDAQSTRGYEQMVSNAAKQVSDPLTEIVLDARSLGR
jgi:thiosulfate/3-mercaptopyruvate sulfurtransferase